MQDQLNANYVAADALDCSTDGEATTSLGSLWVNVSSKDRLIRSTSSQERVPAFMRSRIPS